MYQCITQIGSTNNGCRSIGRYQLCKKKVGDSKELQRCTLNIIIQIHSPSKIAGYLYLGCSPVPGDKGYSL